MSLSLDLSGRVALVTGGGRGIGAGIVSVLMAAGARVVSCGRRELGDLPPGLEHVAADVRRPDEVEELVSGIVARHGRLDTVVNNAGGAPYAPAADASARFHERVLQLNLHAPLLVAQAAYGQMREQVQGGSIINISSVSAGRGSPGTAAYAAANAGVESLTRSLAMEWGPQVRVNSIEVGLCRTEHTGDHYGDGSTVAAIEASIPLRRMARPVEVGQVAAFLASDLASYVSGATVACHGGGEPPVFGYVVKQMQEGAS